MSETAPPTDGIPVGDVVPCCGVGCFMCGLFTAWPDLIGCAGGYECLTCSNDFLACKLPKEGQDYWCNCNKSYQTLHYPKICCKGMTQEFCIDARFSLPPDDEAPCMLTVCFFTLLFKMKSVMSFAKSVKDLDAAAASK